MKTLVEVEPRMAVNATNTPGDNTSVFRIILPGSYMLTANLNGAAGKSGIVIAASGVTLDLMGFELAGVPSGGAGIFVSGGRTNIAIRNGTLRNWTGDGVSASSSGNSQYQDLRLSTNGGMGLNGGANSTVVNCSARSNTSIGISTGDSSTVSNCTVQFNGGHGIVTGLGCTVSGCTAVANSFDGINAGTANTIIGCSSYANLIRGISLGDTCTVSNCTVRSNSADGIVTSNDCTITGCTVRRNDGSGIVGSTGTTISDCQVGFNGAHGISIATDCLVHHNNCRQNGRLGLAAGIRMGPNGQNRIEDNNVTGNNFGIDCGGVGNIIIRNTASANGEDYSIPPNNTVGPIIGIGDPITSTNPWANFSY
ncbi:hypothetical protein AYO41_03980 [Verrucomicrobia bacterium SCGC AG-212-E04]|nr:hypothetical protein AYO41_03980 [Verrucomicrobia bacterium SCGC AG-212-E04]